METTEDLADLEEDEAMTRRALDLLGAGKADAYDAAAYDAALTALREDTRHWWEEMLARGPGELEEVQEPYTADAWPAAIPGRRDPALVRDAPDGAGEPAAHPRPGVRRGAS